MIEPVVVLILIIIIFIGIGYIFSITSEYFLKIMKLTKFSDWMNTNNGMKKKKKLKKKISGWNDMESTFNKLFEVDSDDEVDDNPVSEHFTSCQLPSGLRNGDVLEVIDTYEKYLIQDGKLRKFSQMGYSNWGCPQTKLIPEMIADMMPKSNPMPNTPTSNIRINNDQMTKMIRNIPARRMDNASIKNMRSNEFNGTRIKW